MARDGLIGVFLLTSRVLKRWLWDTHVRLVIGVTASLLLGWLAVRGMDWGLVSHQFHEFSAGWALASLVIVVLASVFRAYRWYVLFVGERVPFTRLFVVQNAGVGLNNLAPFRMVSEGAQLALLTLRYRVPGGVALATLGMERILDMLVTSSVLMVGLIVFPSTGKFTMFVVGAFVFALGSVFVIPLVIWLGGRPLVNRVPVLASTAACLVEMRRARYRVAYSSLLTLVHWALLGFACWVLAHGMGLDISPFVATLAILGTLYFATAVPGLPAAVGTFEFAVVYVLRFFDVPQELAFSYGLVIHAVVFLPPIVVALVFFPALGFGPIRRRSVDVGTRAQAVSIQDQEMNPT